MLVREIGDVFNHPIGKDNDTVKLIVKPTLCNVGCRSCFFNSRKGTELGKCISKTDIMRNRKITGSCTSPGHWINFFEVE